ncbi:hypothetical protein F5I97DRAFT_1826747 [Phlebopus sp. FC_14]|nr:hypothetical protein F5I97DRAFT_1826747 [Phlebopus sp. FC_14]
MSATLKLPQEDYLVPDEWTEEEHHQMDEKIRHLCKSPIAGDIGRVATVLTHIANHASQRLDERFLNVKNSEAILLEDNSLMQKILDGWNYGFKEIRLLSISESLRPHFLKPEPTQEVPPVSVDRVFEEDDLLATRTAWNREFVGDAARALWDHICHFTSEPLEVQTIEGKQRYFYARYSAIVQSSGMGKSRAVDEMSKNHFVIPVNLLAQGFPPADEQVYKNLTQANNQGEAFIRACAFLHALFTLTGYVLLNRDNIPRPPDLQEIDTEDSLASYFRKLMRHDMSFRGHGEFRRKFFEKVCQLASQSKKPVDEWVDKVMQREEFGLNKAFDELCDILEGCSSPLSSTGERPTKILKEDFSDGRHLTKDCPLVITAFDEIQGLTSLRDDGSWSHFGELRRALRALSRQSLFTLFLTTTGDFGICFTAPERDLSARVIEEGEVMPPFTDLGFDLMAKSARFSKGITLSAVSSEEHFRYLGRPIWYAYDNEAKVLLIRFAAKKLLGGIDYQGGPLTLSQKLACLAHRIPIEFLSSACTSRVGVEERTQVQAHMRVVLQVDDTLQTMVTASPSEPVLAEAAYWLMSSFDIPDALEAILGRFSVNKGDRGELLVMLLCIMARDAAVGPPNRQGRPQNTHRWCSVPSLLESLFQPASGSQIDVLLSFGVQVHPTKHAVPHKTRLRKEFEDSKVYFNHFTKVHEQNVIDKRFLMRLMARGAAVLCANCQPGIDGIIPFLFRGDEISEDNIGAILFQVKNDQAYTHRPKVMLFEAMDPHYLGIRASSHIPVIRMVFALAATTPTLVQPALSLHASQEEHSYLAYDFWVAGISPTILQPIKGKQNTWDALLQASYGWQEVYKARSRLQTKLRKFANPGVATGEEHWENWWDDSKDD